MLPSVGVPSAKDDVDGGASEIDVPRARLTAPRAPKQHTELLLHWNISRNAEDVPNAHRVAVRNEYCCVRQRRASARAKRQA